MNFLCCCMKHIVTKFLVLNVSSRKKVYQYVSFVPDSSKYIQYRETRNYIPDFTLMWRFILAHLLRVWRRLQLRNAFEFSCSEFPQRQTPVFKLSDLFSGSGFKFSLRFTLTYFVSFGRINNQIVQIVIPPQLISKYKCQTDCGFKHSMRSKKHGPQLSNLQINATEVDIFSHGKPFVWWCFKCKITFWG